MLISVWFSFRFLCSNTNQLTYKKMEKSSLVTRWESNESDESSSLFFCDIRKYDFSFACHLLCHYITHYKSSFVWHGKNSKKRYFNVLKLLVSPSCINTDIQHTDVKLYSNKSCTTSVSGFAKAKTCVHIHLHTINELIFFTLKQWRCRNNMLISVCRWSRW